MSIKSLARKGCSNRRIAHLLGVTEGAVRYHRRRMAAQAADGRAAQSHRASAYRAAIEVYLQARGERTPANVADLHAWLVAEHDYGGSLRSVQRYVRSAFPPPPRRARRRVETPPGAQAQVDWAEFRGIRLGGRSEDLYALHMQLSHSRFPAVVWSRRKHLLAWLWAHNEAFRRLEGIPATLRVDNEKTAVSRGAGAWGEINRAYRRYAETVRFHIDACAPRAPQTKGKVERRIRDHRLSADPRQRHWRDLAELQRWTDERVLAGTHRRLCPATGTSVYETWQAERAALAALPILPEPFDLSVSRRVGADCTVAFEGRSYSVPFRLAGQCVEVRGCNEEVQMLAGAGVVASHPRHTRRRLVLDPAHFEGPATDTVAPPPPLGKMGQRLAEIAALAPEQRPLDLYAALAEVAR